MIPPSTPGVNLPIEPGFIAIPGRLQAMTQVSVCPYPSRTDTPNFSSKNPMTPGVQGSPAVSMTFRSFKSYLLSASSIVVMALSSVGVIHALFILHLSSSSNHFSGSNLPEYWKLVAPAFKIAPYGAQYHLAH